jgi:hypothetical protein
LSQTKPRKTPHDKRINDMSTAGKLLLAATVVFLGAGEAARAAEPVAMLPVDVQDVRVTEAFWGGRLKIMRENTIPHSWDHVKSAIMEMKLVADPDGPKPPPSTAGASSGGRPTSTR